MRVVVTTQEKVDIPGNPNTPTYANSPGPPRKDGTVIGELYVTRGGDGDVYEWDGTEWLNRGVYTDGPYDLRTVNPVGVPSVYGTGASISWARTDSEPIPGTNPPEWVWIIDEGDLDANQWSANINYVTDPTTEAWHTDAIDPNDANRTR